MKSDEKLLREWIRNVILSEVDVPTDMFGGPKFSGGRKGGMFGRLKDASKSVGKTLGDYTKRMAARGINVAALQTVTNDPILFAALGIEGIESILDSAKRADLSDSLTTLVKSLSLQSTSFIKGGLAIYKAFNIPNLLYQIDILAKNFVDSQPALVIICAGFIDLLSKIQSLLPGSDKQKLELANALVAQWINGKKPDPRHKNFVNIHNMINSHHSTFTKQIKNAFPNIRENELSKFMQQLGTNDELADFFQKYYQRNSF